VPAGPGRRRCRGLLLGAALALVVPAAVVGILLERFLFGLALVNMAAGYETLSLDAAMAEVLSTVVGLGLAAAVAVFWVARQADRESVVTGLSSS
jgi:hypothetical protein